MDRIVIYPNSVLRTQTRHCRLSEKNISAIILRLRSVMRQEKHGIGIAAPQLGISERIAIVDVSSRDPKAKPLVIINPEILEARDPAVGKEGCMSVPDYTALVKRFLWIRFSYTDELGVRHEKISTGIEAICVQHELDHLDGKLLIDRVQCLKTDLLPRAFSRKK